MGAEFKAENWTKRILIDICTQHDFLDAGAILQVANRETLIPKLKEVFEWAQVHQWRRADAGVGSHGVLGEARLAGGVGGLSGGAVVAGVAAG